MTVESYLPASASSMPSDLDLDVVPSLREGVEAGGATRPGDLMRPGDLVDDWVAAASCASPSFAPDGSLAYVGNRAGHPALWVRDVAGEERLVDVGPGHVGSVIWSPDGVWIAVTVAPGGGEHTEVRVVHPDGSGLRRLAGGVPAPELSGDVVTLPTGAGGSPSAASHGRWTWDSAWLAVCESDATGLTHAMLVDPETGRRHHLATGQA
nr:hypothetical protein [Micromonospora sp. DSM 115978]